MSAPTVPPDRTRRSRRLPERLALLRPRRRARSPRAARGPRRRPRRRAPARLAPAPTRRSTPASPRSPCSSTRRPRRRQHLRHRARRHRRHAPVDRRPRVVVHLSTELPGGLWLVEARRRSPAARTSPVARRRATTATLRDGRRPRPRGARARVRAAVAGHARRPGTEPLDVALDATAGPSATATSSATGRSAATRPCSRPSRAAPRCPARPARSRPRSSPTSSRGHRRGRSCSTPACRRSRATSCRTPSATGCPGRPPTRSTAPTSTAGRVIAVGTTVVRALESAVDRRRGSCIPSEGWTEVVITPERGVRAVDGLLTGWHEPAASHLPCSKRSPAASALELAYESAFAAGYHWHEFGDSHLLLP